MRHHGPQARAIVWEHNTHIGDARFTDMADSGMVNVGQLVREESTEPDVVLVGFGSYQGTVIAAEEWDAPMQRMRVPPGRHGSWEDLLHRTSGEDSMLVFRDEDRSGRLATMRGHRAIGVVYHPEVVRHGNYVPTGVPRRYDAFLFFPRTEALHPLHMRADVEHEEVPETYPSGV